MKSILKTICIFTLLLSTSFATTINVPSDTSTIQGGIDMAVNGDTVLVQPNTYYENINFNGKNIVVGSLTLITGDTSYISQTVIDADSSYRVATFWNGEDSTAVLCGFTLRNGYIDEWDGGGIYVSNSSPHLSYLLVKNNIATYDFVWHTGGQGGGILLAGSNTVLEKVSVKNNYVYGGDAAAGGGIHITNNSNPVLVNVKVIGNVISWSQGGGIYCSDSNPIFSNVTVTGNSASYGGGIAFQGDCHPYFDTLNRSSIYSNHSTYIGHDLYSWCDSTISIIVDTFTILNPDSFHAYPLNKFTFDILHDTSGNPNIIEKTSDIPLEYTLKQNYPNPFNPSTKIKYTLPKSQKVKIEIFNLLGQKISTLINKQMPAGQHEVNFVAKDLSSGVFLYRIQAGNYVDAKKMILLR